LGFPAPPWADAEEDDMAAATKRRGEEEEAAAAARRWRRRRAESMGGGWRGGGRQDMTRPIAARGGRAMRHVLAPHRQVVLLCCILHLGPTSHRQSNTKFLTILCFFAEKKQKKKIMPKHMSR
jgi:hypothetical protein